MAKNPPIGDGHRSTTTRPFHSGGQIRGRKALKFKVSSEPLKNSPLAEYKKLTLQFQHERQIAARRASHEWRLMKFEKLIFATILLLAGVCANYFVQRMLTDFKTATTSRQAELAEIRKAFGDVWPKLYAYETSVNDFGGAIRTMELHKDFFPHHLLNDISAVKKRGKEEHAKFDEAFDAIKSQQHILGDAITSRSEWYLRNARMIALVYEGMLAHHANTDTYSRSIDEQAIAASERKLKILHLTLTELDKMF